MAAKKVEDLSNGTPNLLQVTTSETAEETAKSPEKEEEPECSQLFNLVVISAENDLKDIVISGVKKCIMSNRKIQMACHKWSFEDKTKEVCAAMCSKVADQITCTEIKADQVE
jgi:hypothetical protein